MIAGAVDVHVVTNSLPRRLSDELAALGFRELIVSGGDPRVRMEHLLSAKATSRSEGDALYRRVVGSCADAVGFSGYVEEEVVAEDLVIRGDQVRASLADPYPVHAEACPVGKVKACDIHATASACDPDVIAEFRRAGFYFLELTKPSGVVTVNTLQFAEMRDGLAAWGALKQWLERGVAFTGNAKFEVTANMHVFGGYSVPPLVPALA